MFRNGGIIQNQNIAVVVVEENYLGALNKWKKEIFFDLKLVISTKILDCNNNYTDKIRYLFNYSWLV